MSRQTSVSPQEDHQIAAVRPSRVDKLSLFRDRLDDGLHMPGWNCGAFVWVNMSNG